MDSLRDSPVGITERAIAIGIDIIITFIFAFTINLIFGFSVIVSAVIFSYCYASILPLLWNGYTIGKRMVGIRIASLEGEKLTLSTMVMRGVIAQIFYSVTGGILSIISVYLVVTRKDKRSIHDLLAQTYVTSNFPEQEGEKIKKNISHSFN